MRTDLDQVVVGLAEAAEGANVAEGAGVDQDAVAEAEVQLRNLVRKFQNGEPNWKRMNRQSKEHSAKRQKE